MPYLPEMGIVSWPKKLVFFLVNSGNWITFATRKKPDCQRAVIKKAD